MAMRRILVALPLLALVAPAPAQKHPPQPRFAVVSIVPNGPNFRPARAGRDQPGPVFPGGKYIDHHTALYELVWFAYPSATVPNQSLIGLPPWAYSAQDSFDFEAEAAPGTSPSIHQMRRMMRTVLNVTERSPRPPHVRPGWMRGVILRGLRNGLGLKLVAGKAPVPVMVVDHVERPSKN